jgi:hypothetical protein
MHPVGGTATFGFMEASQQRDVARSKPLVLVLQVIAGIVLAGVAGWALFGLATGDSGGHASRPVTAGLPIPPPRSASCATPSPSSYFLTPASGSRLIWSDDCSSADPLPLYGAFVGGDSNGAHDKFVSNMSQIAPGRLGLSSSGGPLDMPYRTLTVQPQDVNWSAPRDALGYNWHKSSDAGWNIPGPGPTVLWHEGERRLLTTWVRLDSINYTSDFRQLFEIKQSEPFDQKPSGGAMFELQQRKGDWMAISQWTNTWTIPVTQPAGSWVPISVEGFFSADPSKGWIRFKIGDQTSPVFHQQTLLRDTSSGASVPSFLEMGPYQDAALPPFSLGFADVRVYG